ncbi:hypothetical protein JQ596_06785 [Bradyrhizobium manausense]|uniref:DUF6894 family protein n=1 Tax=Bradyrhizobium TaxID=374 RepID=UPI001BAD18C4|nr:MULTISPECIES: hypothetical protein [Bradyrhizobium]MBR0825234.1 hypothetical protein [Bradyrhizobium manausense]UVO28421.1 hypothetical protein KUF59_39195 [Bradyrhizobium arachidis]
MTRYYFDLHDDDGLFADEEGLELSSLRAVQTEATRSLVDMARDAMHGSPDLSKRHMAIEVRNEAGPVMQVRLHFAVEKPKQ